jgi:uncharacterized protein (UPF0333 family)
VTQNLGQIDRTVRIVLGAVLLAISYVFPLVTTGAGKAVVTVIAVILLATGLVRY